ncbi:type II toxin-antitoxin system death-on-curing family toxin [Aestuariibius insulae]|uniref:type II toxin-antitoxin system death-on-curing family toxin n=1 Tax=Aestuariibius insulae TaxID=2058287 RepID=UPI00345EDFA3
MAFNLLTTKLVVAIHDEVLNPGELQGLARDKSLDGALARVDNKLAYGMIRDVFDLAAAYAEAIATGHCFNDANKRTAYQATVLLLEANSVSMAFASDEIGPLIIELAQRKLEGEDLADWLRARAG